MTRRLHAAAAPLLITGTALTVAIVVAFALAGEFVWGLACGGIVLAYTLVVGLGRGRSATLETLSGTGDERTDDIALRAVAFAGGVLITVILGWWVVAIATGSETDTLTILGAVFGLSFIAACAVLQRRS